MNSISVNFIMDRLFKEDFKCSSEAYLYDSRSFSASGSGVYSRLWGIYQVSDSGSGVYSRSLSNVLL